MYDTKRSQIPTGSRMPKLEAQPVFIDIPQQGTKHSCPITRSWIGAILFWGIPCCCVLSPDFHKQLYALNMRDDPEMKTHCTWLYPFILVYNSLKSECQQKIPLAVFNLKLKRRSDWSLYLSLKQLSSIA